MAVCFILLYFDIELFLTK